MNLFILQFATLEDKHRALRGKLWLFDSYLFSLKMLDGCTPPSRMDFYTKCFWFQFHDFPFMYKNAKYGAQLGKLVGKVIEFDV